MSKFNFFFISLMIFTNIFAKVLIITPVYNRPDFIEYQYKLYKKFLKDEYELVIFDDSDDINNENEIKNICQKFDIKYNKIPRHIHKVLGPSEKTSSSINYSLENLGFYHQGIVAIISSDVFLVKPFSITEYMKNIDIGGLYQFRKHIEYLWDGIIFLQMNNLLEKNKINFDCGVIDNTIVDSGGFLYYYLKKYPDLKIKYFNQIYLNKNNEKTQITCSHHSLSEMFCSPSNETLKLRNFDQDQINCINSGVENVEFFIDNSFFHYRSGTNWDRKDISYHQNKTKLVNKYFNHILDN